MDNGWIKIHRKLIDWEWYKDINTKCLFLHLLLKANHSDKKWKGINIKRGQVLTGRVQLSLETGLSERSIRTSLEHLKSTNELTIKTTSRYSIIDLTNYNSYQTTDQVLDQQTTNKRPTNDQQPTSDRPATDHYQECKECKELEEEKEQQETAIIDSFFSAPIITEDTEQSKNNLEIINYNNSGGLTNNNNILNCKTEPPDFSDHSLKISEKRAQLDSYIDFLVSKNYSDPEDYTRLEQAYLLYWFGSKLCPVPAPKPQEIINGFKEKLLDAGIYFSDIAKALWNNTHSSFANQGGSEKWQWDLSFLYKPRQGKVSAIEASLKRAIDLPISEENNLILEKFNKFLSISNPINKNGANRTNSDDIPEKSNAEELEELDAEFFELALKNPRQQGKSLQEMQEWAHRRGVEYREADYYKVV